MALAHSPEAPQPLARVIGEVKGWVERLGEIWVEAQIIEIKRRTGPVHYLRFRDLHAEASATITCTQRVLDTAGPITEGTTVTALIKPSVWTKSTSLTFTCREMRPSGEGRLLAMLEQRKRLLQAEGLFDPLRKRPLPYVPRVIGLITGANSAAERDVISNIHRRWPAAAIEIRHTLVQGPAAAGQVMAALTELDAAPRVDVIIIARGGGSLEDLLPFSDEGLVRAVAQANTPIVSAIGHEPDSPILDLVADVRASTPTDAAKRVVPDAQEESRTILQLRSRTNSAIHRRVRQEQEWLTHLRSRPVLRNPGAVLAIAREQLDDLRMRLTRGIDQRLTTEQTWLHHTRRQIKAISPGATIERGYTVLTNSEGIAVNTVDAVTAAQRLTAHLIDGTMPLSVGIPDELSVGIPDEPPVGVPDEQSEMSPKAESSSHKESASKTTKKAPTTTQERKQTRTKQAQQTEEKTKAPTSSDKPAKAKPPSKNTQPSKARSRSNQRTTSTTSSSKDDAEATTTSRTKSKSSASKVSSGGSSTQTRTPETDAEQKTGDEQKSGTGQKTGNGPKTDTTSSSTQKTTTPARTRTRNPRKTHE